MNLNDPIDRDAACGVLGWAGEQGGWGTGGFTCKLLDAGAHADGENLGRLALGFPRLMHALSVYKFDPNGIKRLQEAAGYKGAVR